MNQWTTHPAEYDAALVRLRKIAEENDLALNPDEERVAKVVGLMTENCVNAGAYYCPCKQSRPLSPASDTICPCPEWQTEIARDGHCFCRLFFSRPGGES